MIIRERWEIPLVERTAGLSEQLIGMSPVDWDVPTFEPQVTAHVGGRPVQIRRCLLPRRGEQPVVTVTVSLQLTVRDVAVILARFTNDEPLETFSDDELRAGLAAAVLNNGSMAIEEWRMDPRERWRGMDPGTEWAPDAEAELLKRAAAVFDGGCSA